jgi:positive regulator of sigma E activity
MGGDKRERHVIVVNGIGAVLNDLVSFDAPPGRVILSALMIWIFPIIAMIIGYFVAERFATGFVPILSSLVFLAASFGLIRLIDNAVAGGTSFYPSITKILPASDSALSVADCCPQQPDRC